MTINGRKEEYREGWLSEKREGRQEERKGRLDRPNRFEKTRQNSMGKIELIMFSLYVHRCTVITFDQLFS